jgi:ATP synthase protein I
MTSDDPGEKRDPDRQLPDEAALSARLRRLGDRLAQDRAGQRSELPPDARPAADGSAMARGLRLSSELVAGVLVGAVIGYMLDRWLGLSPWGFIVFVLLGFVAGILNLMRAAGVAANSGDRAP